jgi:Holliday junction resolvase
MLEGDLQKKVIKFLKAKFKNEPAFFWKASDKFRGGIPDIMGCYKGQMWSIELKVGKNTTSELQDITIEQLQKAGALVTVCWTMEEVEEFIDNVMKRGGNNV